MPQLGAELGWGARALGWLGLLPQVAAFVLIIIDPADAFGVPILLACGYPSLILSFLGGIWWGVAMRRDQGQGELAALAVLPALVPLLLVVVVMVASWRAALVLLGIAIIATLLVDRRLAANGEVPTGWMALRTPLSLGLGLLTIAAGVVGALG